MNLFQELLRQPGVFGDISSTLRIPVRGAEDGPSEVVSILSKHVNTVSKALAKLLREDRANTNPG